MILYIKNLSIYQKEIDKGDVQNIAKSWFGLLQFSYDFVSFLQAVLLYHNDTCFPDVRIFVVERLMGYISYLINGYKKDRYFRGLLLLVTVKFAETFFDTMMLNLSVSTKYAT